jgi:hypothetical protein
MAPELLDPDEYNIPDVHAERPTKESDVYALGMTVWEVCTLAARYSNGSLTLFKDL